MEKKALILEGGALRTFYTMGVLDAFLEMKVSFDYIVGVSGGALCALNYLSLQQGRTKRLNLNYLHDPRYKGFSNVVRKGTFFDIAFLLSDVVESEDPFDVDVYIKSDTKFEIGATNIKTGKIEYFEKPDIENFNQVVASATIPFISRKISIDDRFYLDGGMADAIPYQHAKATGYEKCVVVLTQDQTYIKHEMSTAMKYLSKVFYHAYPQFRKTLENRHITYNATRELINEDVSKQSTFLIQPQKPVSVSRAESDNTKLEALYQEGYRDAMENMDAMLAYLES